MADLQQAIDLWRQRRRNVSDHRETNVQAWMLELNIILAELGLEEPDFLAYVNSDPQSWVEIEYTAFEEESSSPPGSV